MGGNLKVAFDGERSKVNEWIIIRIVFDAVPTDDDGLLRETRLKDNLKDFWTTFKA